MKSLISWITASSLLAGLGMAQPRYSVVDLSTLRGAAFSQATYINNPGVVTGVSAAADGTQHSVIWYGGFIGDFGTNPLGGPNSEVFGINENGQALGQAEGADKDPNGEDFCGYGTGLKCLPFLWHYGVTTQLPTLGGANGSVGQINGSGEASGYAENGIHDPDCKAKPASNGTGPQAVDFEAVIWGPAPGQIRQLQQLPGDTVGMAIGMNDSGQAVGTTGTCSTVVLPPLPAVGLHAVLWEKDGSVHDLGNLGGKATTTAPGQGNIALSINNQGQVVGASLVSSGATVHAFLWTTDKGMQDLGTLTGDVGSAGLGINEESEVVGPSLDSDGNPRAYLWKNGVMTDLNALVPEDFPLFLLLATSINDAGQIVGFGVQKEAPNDIHAFLATPDYSAAPAVAGSNVSHFVLSEHARQQVQQKLRLGRVAGLSEPR